MISNTGRMFKSEHVVGRNVETTKVYSFIIPGS